MSGNSYNTPEATETGEYDDSFLALPDSPEGLPAEFPLRLMPRFEQGVMSAHRHRFTELVIIQAGCGEHGTTGASFPLVPGNVFVVPPECAHFYSASDGLVLSNLCFWPERIPFLRDPELNALPGFGALLRLEPQLRESQQGKGRLQLDASDLERVRALLLRLWQELTERPAGYGFMAMTLLRELLVHLSRAYEAEKKAPARRQLTRLAKALRLIEQEYTEPLELQTLAQAAGLSKSYLLKSFREAFGMPPLEYLLHVRIQKAMPLLREGRRSVTDAAYAVGFNDSNYFSRQFKRQTGLTPREYSRQAP